MSTLHTIFGTGPAGVATATALAERGIPVRMVNRSGARDPRLPASVEIAMADASDPASARNAAEGASVIYNCLNAPYHQWSALFPGLQAGVLSAAIDLRARLVVLENVYMYGDVASPLTENMPYLAETRKGKLRAAMSRELTAAHESGKVEVAIGRASDFYGPGVEGSAFGDRTLIPLLKGKAAEVTGKPDTLHTYTYINDVGRGLATLGTQPEAFGQIWHLPNAPAITSRQMIEIAAGLIGVKPKLNAVSKGMLYAAGFFIPAAREIVEMLYEFDKPFIVDSSKFARAFGAAFTPIPEGMACTIEWYQKHFG
jgi:nucleoside-diphosphate-sugar epimerase